MKKKKRKKRKNAMESKQSKRESGIGTRRHISPRRIKDGN
jgi:hypothetical protein